jgi:16S rRNA (guanine(966)-N(2))-methyltransferase RsmD
MRIFGGQLKNKVLKQPKNGAIRPTTGKLREAVFNICQGEMDGAAVLDLFAGSGAMGFEAMSRGAASVLFVDNDLSSVKAIQENIAVLGLKNSARVIAGEAVSTLSKFAKQGQQFDWIYVDPPYGAIGPSGRPYSHEILAIIDASSLLKSDGTLFIEETAAAAPSPSDELKTLSLKSARRFGRSTLLHYTLNT